LKPHISVKTRMHFVKKIEEMDSFLVIQIQLFLVILNELPKFSR
jgi:hypothetical protein